MGLRVTDVADRKISVAWNDQSDNEDGFRIRFRGEGFFGDHNGTKSVGRNEESASLTGLFNNYEYAISVVAFNAGGESARGEEVRAKTPARSISVSKEGAGTSSVFIVTGAGFTPNSLVLITITAENLQSVTFPETAEGDGKFVSRHSLSCASSTKLTFTAHESLDPLGTAAIPVVTTCP